MKEYRRLWATLVILALMSPVGLYLPQIMKAGSAWGEWGVDEVGWMLGYAPAGMQRTAIWKAPMPSYTLPGQEQARPVHASFSYVLSALVGLVACGGGGYLLTRWVTASRWKRGT